MPPMYIPLPIPIPINGGGGGDIVVSGAWAVVLWACVIILLILLGVLIYGLCRDLLDDYRQDRKMKKEYKERRKRNDR